jgi:hypothetical protein
MRTPIRSVTAPLAVAITVTACGSFRDTTGADAAPAAAQGIATADTTHYIRFRRGR